MIKPLWQNVTGLVLAALLAGALAQAETYGDAYGLGIHAADPSKGGALEDLLHISAVLTKADGSPATLVSGREVVQLAVSASRAPDLGAVRVKLRCRVYFTDADNNDTPGTEGICFNGEIGSGETASLKLRLKFRGSAKDPAATFGVAVEVRDEISGEAMSLMPTWGWAGQ